jgi:cell division protein FtsL
LASTRSAAVAAPARRPRPKTGPKAAPKAAPKPAQRRPAARARRKAHSRAAIAWIVVFGVLLAGVVFVNLAVLQLNLRLDKATQQRSQLKADNAALVAQLSSALASPRIQKLAHSQDGLVQADPSSIDYIDLSK